MSHLRTGQPSRAGVPLQSPPVPQALLLHGARLLHAFRTDSAAQGTHESARCHARPYQTLQGRGQRCCSQQVQAQDAAQAGRPHRRKTRHVGGWKRDGSRLNRGEPPSGLVDSEEGGGRGRCIGSGGGKDQKVTTSILHLVFVIGRVLGKVYLIPIKAIAFSSLSIRIDRHKPLWADATPSIL